MCTLCDQVTAQSFRIAKPNDRLAMYELPIAPVELLDNGSVAVTRRATATDGVLDYYLHTPGGAVTVSGGGFGEQEIQSLAIPASDQDYFNAMVRRLDSIIDLDFRQVNNALGADVDLYYDTEINLGGGGVTLGLATTSGLGGWELYLNYPALNTDEPYRRYALIHEFGHSLGLEHPFEARDGDVFNGSTDPWSSAYPEDTVMAYRSPKSESWPSFFSNNDLNALIEVWGAERQLLVDSGSRFDGNPYDDDVFGGRGDDRITGNAGFDSIAGGAGNDELRGGINADQVRGGLGNDRIFGGRGHDTIFGGKGDDVIRGGFGGDLFIFSEGNDLIEDFRFSDNDRIQIEADVFYQLHQHGNQLQLVSDSGTLSLNGVNLNQLLIEDRIVVV